MAVYYPKYDYFKPTLRARNIELIELKKHWTWGMIRDLKRVIATRRIDWVISFLEGPGYYSLLTKMLRGGFKICVAERSANIDGQFNLKQKILHRLYSVANLVTTNSVFQSRLLGECHPALKNRIHTIHNCVGEEFFLSQPESAPAATMAWDLDRDWLAVVGQISPWKNLHGLIDGLLNYRERFGAPIKIRWAGRPAEDYSDYVDRQRRRIVENQLDDRIELIGNVDDVPSFLRSSSGLLHPSTIEGFPNAVCEAFAVGLPALIGDISDARILVGSDRGFVFDPHSAASIASALHQFVALSSTNRWSMGQAARDFAIKEFREDVMAAKYAEILAK